MRGGAAGVPVRSLCSGHGCVYVMLGLRTALKKTTSHVYLTLVHPSRRCVAVQYTNLREKNSKTVLQIGKLRRCLIKYIFLSFRDSIVLPDVSIVLQDVSIVLPDVSIVLPDVKTT